MSTPIGASDGYRRSSARGGEEESGYLGELSFDLEKDPSGQIRGRDLFLREES
jgi:hypothetical protein